MTRKISSFILALMIAITLSSCGSSAKKNFSTEAFKKFVENSKKNGEMDYEKTKKAYKGIFPKMKMK